MDEGDARELFATARVARLATVSAGGQPHLVPIVFALSGSVLYSAVDQKPKRTTKLQRLANIAANPAVTVLADHYDEQWAQLWWVRADGTARVLPLGSAAGDPAGDTADGADEAAAALELLAARYEQYRSQPPVGPVLAVDVLRWSGWHAS